MKKFLLILIFFSLGFILSQYINKNSVQTLQPDVQVIQQCPVISSVPYIKTPGVDISGEIPVIYPPVEIERPSNIEIINEPFDPLQLLDGKEFYSTSNNPDPWYKGDAFDVDTDKNEEIILTANTAMNHTPHELRIIKNGNVIFKAEGASIGIKSVYDGNGFILVHTEDWTYKSYMVISTRYIHENGKFIPVWKQVTCSAIPPQI